MADSAETESTQKKEASLSVISSEIVSLPYSNVIIIYIYIYIYIYTVILLLKELTL